MASCGALPQSPQHKAKEEAQTTKREDASSKKGWGAQDVVTTKPFQDFIFVTEQQNQPNSVQRQVEETLKRLLSFKVHFQASRFHPPQGLPPFTSWLGSASNQVKTTTPP